MSEPINPMDSYKYLEIGETFGELSIFGTSEIPPPKTSQNSLEKYPMSKIKYPSTQKITRNYPNRYLLYFFLDIENQFSVVADEDNVLVYRIEKMTLHSLISVVCLLFFQLENFKFIFSSNFTPRKLFPRNFYDYSTFLLIFTFSYFSSFLYFSKNFLSIN